VLAEREGVSMNQLISSAVGEKLAALMTEDYLARAKRDSRKLYASALRKVPNVAPDPKDNAQSTRMRTRPAQARKPPR
jgi:hypothetical protein